MFQGSAVALVTPMTSSGKIDKKRFQKLVQFHVEQGTQAIIVSGTTGEGPTLTKKEREQLIKLATEGVAGQVPVIVGIGTYNTSATLEQALEVTKAGANGLLVVTPYYNKPTQEGAYRHFKQIAESVSLPIILYNVPQRTAFDLLPDTIARLAEIPNIVGLKEASGDLPRCRDILALCKDRLKLYSGDDASALAFILQGGKGVISVTANLMPKLMQEMCLAALQGNLHRAGSLNTQLMPLHKKLFVESNPIPVKWAMQTLGWIAPGIRLPLTTLSESYQSVVKEAMKESGVLN